ncbi:hypothetical protein Tco_0443024 [Tanacetum coccineum]
MALYPGSLPRFAMCSQPGRQWMKKLRLGLTQFLPSKFLIKICSQPGVISHKYYKNLNSKTLYFRPMALYPGSLPRFAMCSQPGRQWMKKLRLGSTQFLPSKFLIKICSQPGVISAGCSVGKNCLEPRCNVIIHCPTLESRLGSLIQQDTITRAALKEPLEGMEVVCQEFEAISKDHEVHSVDDLIPDADRLVSCLAAKVL